MQTQIEGKQMDVGSALTKHVEENLRRVVKKYFENSIEAKVIFSKEKAFFKAKILVHAGKGIELQSHGEADDSYPAFDLALNILESRLRKHKNRLKDHHQKIRSEAKEYINSYVVEAPSSEEDSHESEHAVIAEIENPIETMSVADAVMRLELANLNVFMFRNSANNELNAVYMREDNNIGWIDPSKMKK